MADEPPFVLVEHPRPHVAVVQMHRPDRLNAMSIELVSELHDALDGVAEENDTWVVVLTGSGRGFSSGLDLKDHGLVPEHRRPAGRPHRPAGDAPLLRAWCPRLRRMPQPVIAAVNGPAYGGGMCLALGADLRFAAASATFNSTGIVNGLTSTELGASWLLPRLIGVARSNDLLLTGRVVDAARGAGDGARLAGAPRRRACSTSAWPWPSRWRATAPTGCR